MLLLGVPALPIPTGGATHVFEVIAVLLALQLIAGRDEIWLPAEVARAGRSSATSRRSSSASLMKLIRRLEKISRPRLRFLFHHRLSNIVFGLLVIGGSVAAFFAPPFTGLDTLPALGVVLLSLAVLLEDILLAIVAFVVGAAGHLPEPVPRRRRDRRPAEALLTALPAAAGSTSTDGCCAPCSSSMSTARSSVAVIGSSPVPGLRA